MRHDREGQWGHPGERVSGRVPRKEVGRDEHATLSDVLAAVQALTKETTHLRRNTAGLCERFGISPSNHVEDVLEAREYYLRYKEEPTLKDLNFNTQCALGALEAAEYDLRACRSILESAAPDAIRQYMNKTRK